MQKEITVNKIFDSDLSFYETALYQMKIPILIIDSNGNFLYGNRAALLITGYTEAELIQLRFSDLFAVETGDTFSLLKSQKTLECRTNFKHQENVTIPATVKIYGVMSYEKRKHYYQIILKDMYLDEKLLIDLKTPLETITQLIKNINDRLEGSLDEQ